MFNEKKRKALRNYFFGTQYKPPFNCPSLWHCCCSQGIKKNPLSQVPLSSYSSSLHSYCPSPSLQLFSTLLYVQTPPFSSSPALDTKQRFGGSCCLISSEHLLVLMLARMIIFTVYRCLRYAHFCTYVSVWLCIFQPSLWTYRQNQQEAMGLNTSVCWTSLANC